MKKTAVALFVSALLVGILFFAAQARASSEIEAGLRDSIAAEGSGRYLVYMAEQADLSPAYAMDWEERGRFVYDSLRNTAQSSQADVLNYLKDQARQGAVSQFESYFIINAIQVESDLDTFDAIANRSDVAAIYAAKEYAIPTPITHPETDQVSAIEWGVLKIRANEIWTNLGATGEGITVANIDTGVQYTHAALVAQYRGTLTGNHDFNFYDPSNVCGGAVCDNHGHGTHTMGTMVGDDGGANQIGVAPGAIWIAAKGCESTSCSTNALLSSAEWILAPCEFGEDPGHPSCDPNMRPNIVNNSWSGPGGDPWYQASVDAWQASGIIPVFAAGNAGPGSSTIGSPGDYCNVTAAGATDINDNIASFSSRGPGDFPACTDKPDVSAPGVNVRSSVPGGYTPLDGTSMASPHVAGCVALLMSIDPSLTYSDLYDLLTTTAVDLGAAGFDFSYGYGRIDCYAAALLLEPDFALTAEPETAAACVSEDAIYTINVASIGGFTDPVDLDTAGEPAGATIDFSVDPVVPPGSSTLTVGTAAVPAGNYSFDVTGTSTTGTKSVGVGLDIYDTAATVSLASPANGATNVPLTPTFTWSGTGTSYFIEIATDAGFTNIVDSATTSDTSYTSIPLSGNTTYYWRVTADNPCGGTVSETWSFTTANASLVCGATEGFETGAFPADWFYTTSALPGGEWVVSTNNSSAFWDPGPAPEGIYYASANDDLPGSGSNGANDYLYTNIIDLSGVVSASLDFWYHFDGTFGHAAGGVEVSGDGGATWDGEIIVPIGPTWQQYSLDLNAYAGNSNVQIRFHSDDGGFWAAGYAIDAVSLVCEGGEQPNIFVDPLSMSSTQNTNTVVVQPLDIENTGTADLDWEIDEENTTVATAPFSGSAAGLTDHEVANAFVPDVVQGPIVSGPSILVDQPPNQGNGYFADSGCDLCAGQQSIADNFSLDGPASITEIVMWSGYFPTNVPVPDAITVKIHADGGGIPGAELYSEFPVSASRMTTGVILFGVNEYVHTLTLAAPVNLGSGTYWIELYNATGFGTDDWFWETGNVDPLNGIPGSAFAFTTPGSGWSTQADDLSFQVIASTEPQPCDALSDMPWLSVSPDAGTTGAGNTTTVDVAFDSTGLAAGTYTGNLCISSNDPNPGPGNGTDLVVVPVELIVEQPTDVNLSGFAGDAPTAMLPLILSLLAVLALAMGLIARRRTSTK